MTIPVEESDVSIGQNFGDVGNTLSMSAGITTALRRYGLAEVK